MSDVLVTPARERTYRVPAAVQQAAADAITASASAEIAQNALLSGAVTETQLDALTTLPVDESIKTFG